MDWYGFLDSSLLVACRQREIAEAEAALKAVKRFVHALLKGWNFIWKSRWKKAVQLVQIGSSGWSFWKLWQLWNQDMQKTFQEKLEEAPANALLFFLEWKNAQKSYDAHSGINCSSIITNFCFITHNFIVLFVDVITQKSAFDVHSHNLGRTGRDKVNSADEDGS